MKIARITGTATATAKDHQLVGLKLLIANIEDGEGNVLERSVVAVDTCGAGIGDRVILATGSAARLASNLTHGPIDMTVIAIIDHIDLAGA